MTGVFRPQQGNFAFVSFEDRASCDKAIEFSSTNPELDGKRIFIKPANSRRGDDRRNNSFNGGGGGGGDRDRSGPDRDRAGRDGDRYGDQDRGRYGGDRDRDRDRDQSNNHQRGGRKASRSRSRSKSRDQWDEELSDEKRKANIIKEVKALCGVQMSFAKVDEMINQIKAARDKARGGDRDRDRGDK